MRTLAGRRAAPYPGNPEPTPLPIPTLDRFATALADRYRLERELGAGGMATVYLAEDLRHGRLVAIKVLRPELAAVIGAERFVREIRTTAALQHPHILGLIDSGEVDGTAYYVMPYVEGESLRDRLTREKQLPVGDALRIAREVAAALGYAHRHGVIHRDIKPENILLHDGSALVADFGIALAVSTGGEGRMTETGMSLGTPHYMSPEQAMGEREITARSDVYALGVVTYEMLAGDPPFTASTAQAVVAKVLTEEPPSLLARRRTVPPAVEDAVLTALEKLPADRFETAEEFGAALAAGGAGVASRSSPRVRGRPRSMRTAAGLGVLAGLVLAALIGVSAWRLRPRPPIDGFGRATKVTWEQGVEMTPALSPDGRYVAYATGTTGRMRVFVRPVAGGRAVPLTEDSTGVQGGPDWTPDGARILFTIEGEGIFSAPASGGVPRPELPASGRPVLSASWAPDGERIAFAIGDSVFVRDAGREVRWIARVADPSFCRWSPSAELIACASGNSWYARTGVFGGNLSPSRIVIVRVRDGATATVTDSISVNQSPVWSPDGRWLYYLSDRMGPRDIFALRIGGDGRSRGAPVRLTTGLDAHTISLSGDGRRFAYARLTSTGNVWSLPFPPRGAGMASAVPVTAGTQTIEDMEVSRDGKWLSYPSNVSGNSELYRMRLPDGEPAQLTNDPADDFSPAISPDGREMAFHSWRSGTRDIYVMPIDGGPVQQVTSSPRQEAKPVWSPDGRALAFTEFGMPGGIWVTRRDGSGHWSAPVERAASGSYVDWSPDGRRLAYTSTFTGGSLMVVDADSGAPRAVYDSASVDGVTVLVPFWSADGRSIYFKSNDGFGRASFWEIPATGGTPTMLTRLEDPLRPSLRPEWTVGGGRMYFVIQDRQSDVWVMEAARR